MNNFIELHNKGNVCNNTGQYQEAIEWYDKALKVKHDDVNTLFNKSNALNMLGKYEEAIEWYDKALKIIPDHANALFNKGNALNMLGRYKEAIDSYDGRLRLKPDDVVALYSKGCAQNMLERYQEAIFTFNKVLRLQPDHADALNNKCYAINMFTERTGKQPELTEVSNIKVLTEKTTQEKTQKSHDDNNFDIFISYSWKQKKQARKLFNILTNSGLTCWMDDNELELGDQLFQRLADAISSSKLVIFCISKEYINSKNCLREFDFTMEHGKAYIPLLFCKDKRAEFDKWPSTHYVFFTMGKAIYDSEIFKHLDDDNLNIDNPIFNSFLQQIKNKVSNN